MKTFLTDSRRASGARHVVRRRTAMGPHAYGLRPTRTPPHLTGSRPRTTKRTLRFNLGTSSPPSRRPFAGASGRHSRPVKPQLQHGPGEHSVFLPQHRGCHQGLDSPCGLPQALRYRFGGSLCLAPFWPQRRARHARRRTTEVPVERAIVRAGCVPPIWGSRGRRFKSCHPDGK